MGRFFIAKRLSCRYCQFDYLCFMQLSVIILNYNVCYFLQQCLISVQAALRGIEGEVIVVDNASADDSCAMVRSSFPDVTLIVNKDNAGFPKGNNVGVTAAKGKYICILNPDTVVAEDAFRKLLDFAEATPNFGIAGPKLIDGAGCFLPESKRGVPTPWVAFTKITGVHKLLPGKLFGRYYAQHLSPQDIGTVDILVGAFMFMERNTYIDAGGFDEGCFMYSDDIDLSYTVLKSGKDNYYFCKTTALHYKGESTEKDGTYMKRFREAMEFFYKKHFRPSPAFSLFMRTGSFLFTLSKKNSKVRLVIPTEYYLFSANDSLCKAVEQATGKKVTQLSQYRSEMLQGHLPKGNAIEIIFDNEMLSFGDIIAIMCRHSSQGYTFKIRPAGCWFVIGSNSSNDRGEVIALSEND